MPPAQVTLHAHSAHETGSISRLVSLLNAKTGEPQKQGPRCLLKVRTNLALNWHTMNTEHAGRHMLSALPQPATMHTDGKAAGIRLAVIDLRSCNSLVQMGM